MKRDVQLFHVRFPCRPTEWFQNARFNYSRARSDSIISTSLERIKPNTFWCDFRRCCNLQFNINKRNNSWVTLRAGNQSGRVDDLAKNIKMLKNAFATILLCETHTYTTETNLNRLYFALQNFLEATWHVANNFTPMLLRNGERRCLAVMLKKYRDGQNISVLPNETFKMQLLFLLKTAQYTEVTQKREQREKQITERSPLEACSI